jgi:hypothetical protein
MMVDILIFVFIQGLAINGFYMAMDEGMILNPYKKWLQKRKAWFGKPAGLCIRCMASMYGTLTFWPATVFAYGFRWIEVLAWIMDLFDLIYLNFYLYKKA